MKTLCPLFFVLLLLLLLLLLPYFYETINISCALLFLSPQRQFCFNKIHHLQINRQLHLTSRRQCTVHTLCRVYKEGMEKTTDGGPVFQILTAVFCTIQNCFGGINLQCDFCQLYVFDHLFNVDTLSVFKETVNVFCVYLLQATDIRCMSASNTVYIQCNKTYNMPCTTACNPFI
jgi:hypothetical protein